MSAAGSAAAGSGAAGSAAGGSGAAGSGAPVPPEHAGTWRITPLGDSITETTCGTQLLFDTLRASGRTDFDFIGTRENQQACGVTDPDRDCEGHSGYLVTELVTPGPHASELPMWCEADRPDIVLMHFGTNDLWHSDIQSTEILSAFSVVVAALRAVQPNVILFVAQIIPLQPNDCAECPERVRTFNALVPDWADTEATDASPIYVVDQWTDFDAATDTDDGVHPNLAGARKMADVWATALEAQGLF